MRWQSKAGLSLLLSFWRLMVAQPALADVDVDKYFLVGDSPSPFTNVAYLVNHLYKVLLVFGGVLIFLFIIFGGLMYIKGAGQERSDDVNKGQKVITWSIIGFLILFSAYWIIQIIQLITGVPILG